jgi:hypothetical protein
MKKQAITLSFGVSVLIGSAYIVALVEFWGFYAGNNPLNEWLIQVLASQGHEVVYLAAISLHDVLVNVLLALPVAALFFLIKPLNHWRKPVAAAVAAVVVSYWSTEWSGLERLLSAYGFWLGLFLTVGSLPVAFAALRLLAAPGLTVHR